MGNNKKIVKVLRGLPASGKSTIAKELVKKHGYIRINNDDLRESFYNGRKFDKHDESLITNVREAIIENSLKAGYNIVLDNLNLHPKHIEWVENKLKEYPEFSLEVVDIKEEPEVCLIRDGQREKPVGAKVIMDWYTKFVSSKVSPYIGNPELKSAIIADIDGTLADHKNIRGPHDLDKVDLDIPRQNIIDLVKMYHDSDNPYYEIIICSGREDHCREKTVQWLNKYLGFSDYKLFMRKSGDMRKDSIIKKEIYLESIIPFYNIKLVVDDRTQIIRMLRDELGLDCVCQVDDGLF